jgi:hypothetical protein
MNVSSRSLCRLAAASTLFLLLACNLPDDPDGTTETVTGGVLRIGALTDPLDPVDAEAVARVAKALQAEPEFMTADPHTLFVQLEDGTLHVVAGRIPVTTPFSGDVALSDPMGRVMLGDDTEDRVLAIRKGENRFLIAVNRAIGGMAE